MADLARAIQDRQLQTRIRKTMSHCSSFSVETDMPDFLREKLAELDRAFEGDHEVTSLIPPRTRSS